jgi:hypothetical protein
MFNFYTLNILKNVGKVQSFKRNFFYKNALQVKYGLKTPLKTQTLFQKTCLIGGGGSLAFAGLYLNTDLDSVLSKLSDSWNQFLKYKLFKYAKCESLLKRPDLNDNNEDKNNQQNDKFDWYEFFQLLKSEKYYLIGAIFVTSFLINFFNLVSK